MTPEQRQAIYAMDMPERYRVILTERANAGDSDALRVLHAAITARRLRSEWMRTR